MANVPPADLAAYGADSLAALVAGRLTFTQARKPRQALVRVFNPSPVTQGYSAGHTVIEIVNDDMPFLVDSAVASRQFRAMT
ncbi:MAG: hypothetical protein VW338_10415 [Rhodospirillaceae bacterium]